MFLNIFGYGHRNNVMWFQLLFTIFSFIYVAVSWAKTSKTLLRTGVLLFCTRTFGLNFLWLWSFYRRRVFQSLPFSQSSAFLKIDFWTILQRRCKSLMAYVNGSFMVLILESFTSLMKSLTILLSSLDKNVGRVAHYVLGRAVDAIMTSAQPRGLRGRCGPLLWWPQRPTSSIGCAKAASVVCS